MVVVVVVGGGGRWWVLKVDFSVKLTKIISRRSKVFQFFFLTLPYSLYRLGLIFFLSGINTYFGHQFEILYEIYRIE